MTTTTTPRNLPTAGVSVDPSSPWLAGLKDITPFAASLGPFALAIGSAGAAAGLTLAELMAGAAFVLAGAAQLTSIELNAAGAAPVAVLATVALMNARFALYGAGLGTWFTALPMRKRLALAFAIVDVNYLVCDQRFATMADTGERVRYYAAATLSLIAVFITGQVIGYHVGAAVPDGIGLHLAAPLAFAGMLVKALAGRPEMVAATVAAGALLVLTGPLGGAALLVSALVAMLAGAAALNAQEA
ncbi:MAG: AzlC family ABC transporter permease [Actinomycetota bacterium]